MKQALFVLGLVTFATSASAFDSQCGDGSGCLPGPPTARARWRAPGGEHRELWDLVTQNLGLPDYLTGDVELPVWSKDTLVSGIGATVNGAGIGPPTTFMPAPFRDASVVNWRAYGIDEMAQLPDFSYALWDWASGNETCPLGDSSPEDCHAFASHMGALNSNHFLPQAKSFFHYYHSLALQRAGACADMRDKVGGNGRFEHYVQACDQEAFTFEAVAHHFLQDAYSSGHMWQRWGGPDLEDFGGSSGRGAAVLIALASGLIHGTRGVLQAKYPWAGDFRDPLCAPLDPSAVESNDPFFSSLPPPSYIDESSARHEAVGDLYLDDMTSSDKYEDQKKRLFGCESAAIADVALAARVPFDAGGLTISGDLDAQCFGQRVTNGSMYLGAGLDLISAGAHFRLDLSSWVLAKVNVSIANDPTAGNAQISNSLASSYRNDLVGVARRILSRTTADPDGTDLANGGLPALLGAEANGSYVRSPPASYVDSTLWLASTTAEGGRSDIITRAYHRAHATDWCSTMTLDDLEALRDSTTNARCALCSEFAIRHVRIGKNESTYDTDAEPLCHFLTSSPTYVYADVDVPDPYLAAMTWCGCATSQPDGGKPDASAPRFPSSGKSGGGFSWSDPGGPSGGGGPDPGGGPTPPGGGGKGPGSGGNGSGGNAGSGAGGADGSGATGNDGSGGAGAGGKGGGKGNAGSGAGPSGDPDPGDDPGSDPGGGPGPEGWWRPNWNAIDNLWAVVTGDPHITTSDGAMYDFQAVGEFVVETDAKDFVVQARLRPFSKTSTSIAGVSAIAAKIGGRRIGIYAGETPAVHLDGVPTEMGVKTSFADGSAFGHIGSLYVFQWSTGEMILCHDQGSHLDIEFRSKGKTVHALSGLLGDADGAATNDLALRGGAAEKLPIARAELYGPYADSWRIEQVESLFDYPTGQTTVDFTDRGFPRQPATAALLPSDEYKSALAACSTAGALPPAVLEACILDYAATLDPSIVLAYANAPAPKIIESTSDYRSDFTRADGAWTPASRTVAPGGAAPGIDSYAGPFTSEPVTLSLGGLHSHCFATVAFDFIAIGNWAGQTFSVTADGRPLFSETFSNTTATQSYPDGQSGHSARTGRIATDVLAGGTPTDTLYHIRYLIPHSTPTLKLAFTGSGLPAGGIASWALDHVQVLLDAPPEVSPSARAGTGPACQGFDTGVAGWAVAGDAQSNTTNATFAASGGNPGGLIGATDAETGGTWYFAAPASLLGDRSPSYGSLLTYDLEVSPIDNPFADSDVVLIGGGLQIAYDTSPDPFTTWTHYAVPLTEAGWHVGDLSGPLVSQTDFLTVLSSLTDLKIRGEFNSGPDNGSLDNVTIGATR